MRRLRYWTQAGGVLLIAIGLWISGSLRADAAELGASASDEDRVASLLGVSIPLILRECIAVRVGDFETHQNVTVAKATVELRRSIGECGCKSAVLGYSVSTPVMDGKTPGQLTGKLFRASGQIGAMVSREALLVISTDNAARPASDNLLIEFGCAPPD